VRGDRIRRARWLNDMTQVELADRIGKTRTTVTNIENGVQLPTVDTLIMICDVLDVSADWILGR
jgi:transcriptional regulator with XRE-family HTH domain